MAYIAKGKCVSTLYAIQNKMQTNKEITRNKGKEIRYYFKNKITNIITLPDGIRPEAYASVCLPVA